MKKIIVMVAAIAALAINSSAQVNNNAQRTDSRENLMFGIKAGLNLSNVYDAQGDEFNADPKIGLAAGGFVSVPIGKYLGVQPELLFSQKGFKATGNIIGAPYNFTRTTSYIDVPLLVQFKPVESVTLLASPCILSS